MARLSKEQLEAIKKEHGVDTLFSWSRYNCYKNSVYEYFLKYVKRERPTRESIYAILGNLCHDICEDFYLGKIKYEEMIDRYNDAVLKVDMMDLKFDRSDEKKNENIAKKYYACVEEFFKSHKPIEHKTQVEQHLVIKVGEHIFHGFFDLAYKDGDEVHIVDWKTSTIYKGKKIDKEKGQLMLYAEGFRQMGVPLDKIRIKWNFLKYANITYAQKNGKEKTTQAERHKLVDKIKNNLKMWLKDSGQYEDVEIEDMVAFAVDMNTLDNIPEDIKSKFKIEDCYVDIPFSEVEIDELKARICDTLAEIKEKEMRYKITGDDMAFDEDIDDQKSYYFANLCGYSANQHKPYKRYIEELETFRDDKYKTEAQPKLDDNTWMSELGLI